MWNYSICLSLARHHQRRPLTVGETTCPAGTVSDIGSCSRHVIGYTIEPSFLELKLFHTLMTWRGE